MNLFSITIKQLEQGINYASTKQKVISNNIANVETPGYKAKTVQFRDMLEREIENLEAYKTHEKHLSFSSRSSMSYKISTRHQASYKSNGNSVDIDLEMSEMAQNQIYYDALIDRINGKFKSLKSVIKGGKV